MHIPIEITYAMAALEFTYLALFFATFKRATNHIRGILLMGVVLYVIRVFYFINDHHMIADLPVGQSVFVVIFFEWVFHLAVLKLILDAYRYGHSGESLHTHLRHFLKEGEKTLTNAEKKTLKKAGL